MEGLPVTMGNASIVTRNAMDPMIALMGVTKIHPFVAEAPKT